MKSKKTTLATVKSFIKSSVIKNNLFLIVKSKFDSMDDGIRFNWDNLKNDLELVDVSKFNKDNRNTMGISGIWFVNGSANYFHPHETETHYGFRVSNCCGSFVVASKKNL